MSDALEVNVEVDESPQVDTPPAVVIVESSDPTAVPQWGVDLIERVGRLEQNVTVVAEVVTEVAAEVDSAATAANVALDAADTAISIAIDAADVADEVAEVVVATAEETGVLPEVMAETDVDMLPDVTPAKPHPLFRSWDDWRRKIGDV